MKQLIFLPFECTVIVPNRFFVTLENAERCVQNEDDVTLLYCDGTSISCCWINTVCNKNLCKICNAYRKQFFHFLSKKIKCVPYASFFKKNWDDYKKLTFQYDSIEDVKQLEYHHVKIGYAAFSSYITPTRNLLPLINNEFRNYFDQLLRTTILNTDITKEAVALFQPDQVGIFNSRFIVSRPVYEICKHNHIDVMVYETTGNAINTRRLTYFQNITPHNVTNNIKLIQQYWDSEQVTLAEKVQIAEKFYHDRKDAIQTNDKVYIGNQKKDLLPDNWNFQKHNIVLLNSSEDEFASLGNEFEQNLFSSQYHALKYIFEKYKDKDDYHFYLRVHPNLKDVPYSYHQKLYDFNKISPNITIIHASSPVSTYAMIDHADKVIVFGSTTGMEAVYWGKPVILLAYCEYSFLDICHLPQNIEEMDAMILNKTLPVKEKLGALKVAYYRMHQEYAPMLYFPYEIKRYSFLSKSFDLYDWNKKGKIFRKTWALLLQFAGKFYRDKIIKRPLKEDLNALT